MNKQDKTGKVCNTDWCDYEKKHKYHDQDHRFYGSATKFII